MSNRPKRAPIQEDPTFDALMKALAAYVEAHGGKLLVAGGVGIMRYPHDLPLNFSIVIKCTGEPPKNDGD